MLPSTSSADSLHGAFKGLQSFRYRFLVTTISIMLMSAKKFLGHALKSRLMKQLQSRQGHLVMKIKRVDSYDFPLKILVSYCMFSKSLIEFVNSVIWSLSNARAPPLIFLILANCSVDYSERQFYQIQCIICFRH